MLKFILADDENLDVATIVPSKNYLLHAIKRCYLTSLFISMSFDMFDMHAAYIWKTTNNNKKESTQLLLTSR